MDCGPGIVLDRAQLRNVTLDDETLMRELVVALVSAVSQQIGELRSAAERADSKECLRLAHGLIGACGNVGAVSMASLFASVEGHVMAGDFRQCRSSLDYLAVELEKLRREAAAL